MCVIDLETTADAAARGWGPGWPSCQQDKIVPLIIRRRQPKGRVITVSFPGGIRAELHDLAKGILDQIQAKGFLLHPGECWGFDCRAIKRPDGASSDVPSNHSWGLAVDLNAPENAFGGSSHTITPMVVRLFNRYGWRWGGEYHGTKDWMHFEFMGTRRQAGWTTRRFKREHR